MKHWDAVSHVITRWPLAVRAMGEHATRLHAVLPNTPYPRSLCGVRHVGVVSAGGDVALAWDDVEPELRCRRCTHTLGRRAPNDQINQKGTP